MTTRKTNKAPAANPAPEQKDPATLGTVQGMKQAAAMLGRPLAQIRWAKVRGCPAFRNSRVHVGELYLWFQVNPPPTAENAGIVDGTIDGAKLRVANETARKLKIANDLKEGRMIERAAVIARFQLAAGERNAFRAKSEQEHAKRFAQAEGNEAICREVLRGIWDEISAIELSCSEHFKD